MKNMSEANSYTVYGVLFGICFPLAAIVILYFTQSYIGWENVINNAHTNPLLYLIDTAPLVLGIIARIAGLRQDKIHQLAEGLEELVRLKTASLVQALEEAKQGVALRFAASKPASDFVRAQRLNAEAVRVRRNRKDRPTDNQFAAS